MNNSSIFISSEFSESVRRQRDSSVDWMCDIADQIDILSAFTTQPPQLDFVIDGLLAGTVGGLVAPGGAGKSMLGLALAAYVSSGHDPTSGGLPQLNSTGKVVYLPAEDPAEVIRYRLHQLGKLLPSHAQFAVAENLSITSLLGHIPDLCNESWLNALTRAAENKRLMIIDTLRRFHQEEENDNGRMTFVIQRIEQIPQKTGCTVLFLHHTSKFGSQSGDQTASRGASAITDNCRWQGNLVLMSKKEAQKRGVDDKYRCDFVQFVTTKYNYGKPFARWLRRVEGGMLIDANVPVLSLQDPQKKSKKRGSSHDESW